MVQFSKLELDVDGKPVETNIREITQSDIMKCPFRIMVAEHYREDGSCRCNEREHAVMEEWGYKWDEPTHTWVSPDEDDEV